MSYQPHLHKGGELYHARTFGSKNGISNTPGYRAKGRKAVGRFVGYDPQGHPIYDYGSAYNNAVQRYQQQQRINAAVATNAGAKGYSARELRERRSNASMANTRRKETQQQRINAAVATNAGAKGQSARELRERRSNASMANIRKKEVAAKKAYDNSLAGRFNAARTTVGNWLNERGDRASNFISNIAKRARTAIGDARTAIGNAWDGKAGAGTGLDLRNERLTKSVGARTKSGAAALRKGADDAKRAYDNSIVGRFNAARDWMGRRAKDVSDAAGRARTAIGNAWDGSAGKGSAKDKANEAASKAKQYHDLARRDAQAGYAYTGSAYAKASREAQAEARRQQEAYDRSIVGTGERLLNRAGSAIRGGAAAVSSGAKRAGKAVSDSYVRSGASNTTKTLMTKGPIQEIKNDRSYFGGREAQQAKGNKLNVQNAKKSAQERKQYVQQVDRDWGNAQRYLDRLTDKANSAKTEKDRQKALANIDRFMTETYKPLQTAYNNVHKNRK